MLVHSMLSGKMINACYPKLIADEDIRACTIDDNGIIALTTVVRYQQFSNRILTYKYVTTT